MMIVSLGACKKDKKAASGNKNGTKTAMTTKRTVTAKKSTTSVSKTNKNANNETAKNSKTGASSGDESLNVDNAEYNPSLTGTTSKEEMNDLLDNSPDADLPIVQFDQNMDLGGRTIKIVYDTSSSGSPGKKPTEVTLRQNPKAIVAYNMIENAKKKMNFNINWVYRSVDNMVYEYIEAVAAGTKYADIILSAPKRVFPILAVKKLLVPMDRFIDFENDPTYNFGCIVSGTDFLGRKWGLVTNPYSIGYVTFYNRDIFAKEGLKDLQELYEEGGWTWEAMVDIAKAATHDNNGDGIIDQWGVLLNSLDNATHALILSNGTDIFSYDSVNNTYNFTGTNDLKVVRALQLVNDMISSRLTTPDNTVKFDKFPSALVIGKIVSDGLAYNTYGMNFGIAPLPKGPDVTETQFVDGNGVNAYFIPVNTDPKVAAAIIREAFTYWDISKPEYMNKKDMMVTNITPYLSSQADVEWAIEHFQSPRISHLKCFDDFRRNFNQNVLGRIIINESTPAAALQSQAAALDSVLKSQLQN